MQLLWKVWSFGSSREEMVKLWETFCVLDQSWVVWHSGLMEENRSDLERTQKTFIKLVLEEDYETYRASPKKRPLVPLIMVLKVFFFRDTLYVKALITHRLENRRKTVIFPLQREVWLTIDVNCVYCSLLNSQRSIWSAQFGSVSTILSFKFNFDTTILLPSGDSDNICFSLGTC